MIAETGFCLACCIECEHEIVIPRLHSNHRENLGYFFRDW